MHLVQQIKKKIQLILQNFSVFVVINIHEIKFYKIIGEYSKRDSRNMLSISYLVFQYFTISYKTSLESIMENSPNFTKHSFVNVYTFENLTFYKIVMNSLILSFMV